MQTNIDHFISDYEQWAGQEKYKEFKFISKSLTPAWKNRLLSNKKFNLWGLLFGPIYRMSLGGAYTGMFLLLVEIFICSLIFSITHNFPFLFLSSLGLNFLCSFKINELYIKQKTAFKKKMQDFDPDASVEYFNISSFRLIILTLLSGGFYIIYWFYRQSKAIKICQKDNSISPIADALFFIFTAKRIFKRMHQSFNKVKNFNPQLSAFVIIAVPILMPLLIVLFVGKFTQKPQGMNEIIEILYSVRMEITSIVLGSWSVCIALALIIRKWQYGVQEYCKNM